MEYSSVIVFCAILAFVILVFEVRQYFEGEPLISNLIQWISQSWWPLKWIAIPFWAWLYYHFFWEW